MRIMVLTRSPIPMGNAASSYVWNTVRTMSNCGHEVTVIGCNRGLASDYPVKGEREGIRYENFDAQNRKKFEVYLFDKFWDRYAVKKIKKNKPDLVFLYGGTVSFAKTISGYCKKHRIKYGAFICEWFTEDSFLENADPKMVQDLCGLNPYNAEHVDCAILISSLLYRYYDEHNVPSVWIPNIVDLTEDKWNFTQVTQTNDKLKLAYAGVPGVGKDELGVVIEAIYSLPIEKRNKVEIHIWGSTLDEIREHMGKKNDILNDLNGIVICHGRAKQSQLPELINQCNFTVLIRKPSIRCNAGFSTKLVESFSAGVPVIANLTGDIGTYLQDGINGIIVKDDSVTSCVYAILQAMEYLPQSARMKKMAKKTAEEHFDYRTKINDMKNFLMHIK